MSNYPPGTGPGDPNAPWNEPDTSHDHEWEPAGEPIFEDGAVIFQEECRHVTPLNTEPGYEGERVVTEGIECEETRYYRFDPVKITRLTREEEPNVSIGRSARETFQEKWECVIEEMEKAAFPHGDSVEIKEMNPSPHDGCVVLEHEDMRVRYEPVVEDEL